MVKPKGIEGIDFIRGVLPGGETWLWDRYGVHFTRLTEDLPAKLGEFEVVTFDAPLEEEKHDGTI